MGLRPTHSNESYGFRHPRAKLALSMPKGGGPRPNELDSRFRGNDVTFDGVEQGICEVVASRARFLSRRAGSE
jgi:hypothetical protein